MISQADAAKIRKYGNMMGDPHLLERMQSAYLFVQDKDQWLKRSMARLRRVAESARRRKSLSGFLEVMREAGYRERLEHRFCPGRRWRFDVAFPEHLVAVEIEGGVWTLGRHNRPAGFLRDMEKYNTAAVLGWRVLRYTWRHFRDHESVANEVIRAIRRGGLANGEQSVAW